jgi:hypothetical protein
MLDAGSRLEHGDGVDEAPDEARRWWREAWRRTQAPVAALSLGLSFERVGRRSSAEKWFRHAARARVVPAMERLLGSGRSAAQRESVRWLLRLDALGELAPISTYDLALEFGQGHAHESAARVSSSGARGRRRCAGGVGVQPARRPWRSAQSASTGCGQPGLIAAGADTVVKRSAATMMAATPALSGSRNDARLEATCIAAKNSGAGITPEASSALAIRASR